MNHFSIFTPCFNKREIVLEAIQSVVSQTYTDFTYFIAENSNDVVTRQIVRDYVEDLHDNRIVLIEEYPNRFIPAYYSSVYMNKYLEFMKGIVVWLSDDDLLKPNCLERLNQEFTDDKDVVYWSLDTDYLVDNMWITKHTRHANRIVPIGENVDCMLDGGQIAHRVKCIDMLSKPYWREIWDNDTAHCDGIFFNRLIQHFPFYPIDEVLSTKRTFNKSVFTQK